MIDSFNPQSVWKPFGAFSMGVIQGEGQVVYLKGQVALEEDGRVVGKGDMAAQTRKTLENIENVLATVGGVMGDIFSLTHFVTDIEQFMKTGNVRREFFAEPFPITTTVQIVRLYDPDLLVEITAMAEIPRERFKRPERNAPNQSLQPTPGSPGRVCDRLVSFLSDDYNTARDSQSRAR